MRFSVFAALALSLVFVTHACAQNDSVTAFKEFGDFMVGTWTPTGQDDADVPRRHIYSWMLNKTFIHSNAEQDPNPWHGVTGIEPKSKRLAWWGFFADGTAGPLYLSEFNQNRWVFEGDGAGPDGSLRRRVTVTRTGEATLRGKIEDTVGGVTELVEESDWSRQR